MEYNSCRHFRRVQDVKHSWCFFVGWFERTRCRELHLAFGFGDGGGTSLFNGV